MNICKSMGVFTALAAVVVSSLVACNQDEDAAGESSEVSTAASPIVQQAGVMRFRAETLGNAQHIALLDQAGLAIGSLELTIESPTRVHATQTVRGRVLDATWSDQDLTFTVPGRSALTVHAGAARSADEDQALLDATNDLSVALGVARDVGVFSLVGSDAAKAVRPLTLGTGQDDDDHFNGTNWQWGHSDSAWTNAYNGSQNAAYSGCAAVYPGGGCATFQGATMSTSCSNGSYYTSCTTTITPGSCVQTGSCPH